MLGNRAISTGFVMFASKRFRALRWNKSPNFGLVTLEPTPTYLATGFTKSGRLPMWLLLFSPANSSKLAHSWECSWCGYVLPALNTISLRASSKAHWKNCKGKPQGATQGKNLRRLLEKRGVRVRGRTKGSLGGASRFASIDDKIQQYNASNANNPEAHDLMAVYHGDKNQKYMPTCRKCTVYWLNSNLLFQKQKHQKCHGPLKRQQLFNSSGRRTAWKQATLARKQQLSKAWNIIKQELKDLNSSGKSKRPVPRSSFWERDSTDDGDVEPNPGPLRLASLELSRQKQCVQCFACAGQSVWCGASSGNQFFLARCSKFVPASFAIGFSRLACRQQGKGWRFGSPMLSGWNRYWCVMIFQAFFTAPAMVLRVLPLLWSSTKPWFSIFGVVMLIMMIGLADCLRLWTPARLAGRLWLSATSTKSRMKFPTVLNCKSRMFKNPGGHPVPVDGMAVGASTSALTLVTSSCNVVGTCTTSCQITRFSRAMFKILGIGNRQINLSQLKGLASRLMLLKRFGAVGYCSSGHRCISRIFLQLSKNGRTSILRRNRRQFGLCSFSMPTGLLLNEEPRAVRHKSLLSIGQQQPPSSIKSFAICWAVVLSSGASKGAQRMTSRWNRLVAKLGGAWVWSNNIDNNVAHLEFLLAEETKRQRARSLQQWRQTMKAAGKGATAWLKPSLALPAAVCYKGNEGELVYAHGGESHFDELKKFWTPIWHRNVQPLAWGLSTLATVCKFCIALGYWWSFFRLDRWIFAQTSCGSEGIGRGSGWLVWYWNSRLAGASLGYFHCFGQTLGTKRSISKLLAAPSASSP